MRTTLGGPSNLTSRYSAELMFIDSRTEAKRGWDGIRNLPAIRAQALPVGVGVPTLRDLIFLGTSSPAGTLFGGAMYANPQLAVVSLLGTIAWVYCGRKPDLRIGAPPL